MEAGIDSLGAVELRNQLQRAMEAGVTLSPMLVYDHPTVRLLAVALSPKAIADCNAGARASIDPPPTQPQGLHGLASFVRGARLSLIFDGLGQAPETRYLSACQQATRRARKNCSSKLAATCALGVNEARSKPRPEEV